MLTLFSTLGLGVKRVSNIFAKDWGLGIYGVHTSWKNYIHLRFAVRYACYFGVCICYFGVCICYFGVPICYFGVSITYPTKLIEELKGFVGFRYRSTQPTFLSKPCRDGDKSRLSLRLLQQLLTLPGVERPELGCFLQLMFLHPSQDIIQNCHGFGNKRAFVEHDALSPLCHCGIRHFRP